MGELLAAPPQYPARPAGCRFPAVPFAGRIGRAVRATRDAAHRGRPAPTATPVVINPTASRIGSSSARSGLERGREFTEFLAANDLSTADFERLVIFAEKVRWACERVEWDALDDLRNNLDMHGDYVRWWPGPQTSCGRAVRKSPLPRPAAAGKLRSDGISEAGWPRRCLQTWQTMPVRPGCLTRRHFAGRSGRNISTCADGEGCLRGDSRAGWRAHA